MASPTKRIVVTGANGFTGRAVTKALRARGHSVFGIWRGQESEQGIKAELADTDTLFSFFSEIKPNAVIHLAGISSPTHSSVTEIYDANVTGTANLLEILSNPTVSPHIVIIASSATVYAIADHNQSINEADPLEPRSHSAVSKYAIEAACKLYSERLNIRVVRPFNYTGPGQSTAFLIPKVIAHFAAASGVMEVGNLELERDISDLRDVVECYCRLVEQPSGPPLNICSGSTIKLSSIVSVLSDISGQRMRLVIKPDLIRPNEVYKICGDRRALDELIGNWPRRTATETLSWMYAQATSGAAI